MATYSQMPYAKSDMNGGQKLRHLVIGAGASIAQAIDSKVPRESWPPTMANFAQKTWKNSPFPFLALFLQSKSIDVPESRDAREIFYELEANGESNIEEFMEFAWQIQDRLPAAQEGLSWWDNMMRYSVGDPFALLINQAFWKDGLGFVDLPLTRTMLSRFQPEDLVFSLNYDTLIELGLTQNGTPFTYLPNELSVGSIPVCKPHGSLNMAFGDNWFSFGDPTNLWPMFPTGDDGRAYVGLIPPRMNKSYQQVPMAKMILSSVENREPSSIVMWGIGMTGSDIDLNAIYKSWAASSEFVDIINPDPTIAPKVAEMLGIPTRQFEAAEIWLEST
ncbi:hypothetical protein [Rhizobium leguminosarum]|uniref:SIR2-like domain-containing protein n=1 Tax=Rhizobium leguminosarum TaxID=384 RepID=A0A2Z4YKI4_RHILE|nr:hypothetical protein [Rhizobium leguminosarum]AXA41108.1 hypothetical protein DLJ82_3539 [Rhizobium leguminosarum]